MKTKKRVLSVLLVFAMVIGLMPGMSLTVFAADTSNGIYVNNDDVRSTTSGSGWSYDAGENTLTLNNYSFDGVGSAPPNDSTVIMYYPQNSNKFTINLVGNNTIKQGNGDTNKTWWGIYCRSDLVIKGDGTLNISTANGGKRGAAIYCEKNVTIDGTCTVNATSGSVTDGPQGHGIGGSGNHTLTIGKDAKVTLTGPKGTANYIVKNSSPGLGWTNTEGTTGELLIEPSTSGQYLNSYKKVQFPGKATWTKTEVFASAPAGNEGTVDLSDYVALGGQLDWDQKSTTGTQATEYPKLDGTTLKFKFNELAQNEDEATDTVTIPVKNATSYKDYNITVTVSAPLKMPQIVSFPNDNAPITKTVGDAKFKNNATISAAVENNSDHPYGVITYKSSNANVAVVNSTTGEVDIKGIGFTIITAQADRTTSISPFNDDGKTYAGFIPGSASYTLTVTANPVFTAPIANPLTADGTEQELVTKGAVTIGGEMYYALGDDSETAPEVDGLSTETNKKWTTSVPKKADAGTYYVWYMVKGAENYNDTAPTCITVTIAEKPTPPSPTSSGGSSDPTPQPSGSTYTAKVEGSGDNTESATISATIENGTATIAEVTPTEITKVAEATTAGQTTSLVLDVSGAPGGVSAIEIPKATVENIAAAAGDDSSAINGTTIKLPTGDIEFDATATQSINDQAQGDSVKIEIAQAKQEELTAAQQETLKNENLSDAKVVGVSVTSGNSAISDFSGGKARVSFADKAPSDKNPNYFHMYFPSTAGTLTRMLTTHLNDFVQFLTGHNSEYVLVYDETDLNENVPPISGAVVENLIYTGTEQAVKVSSVTADAVELKDTILPADAYMLSGDVKVTDVGTYKVVITAKDGGGYRGSTEVTYEVKKADQKMTVSAKDVKAKRGKKIKPEKVFTIENTVGKVKYTKVEGDKKIKISDSGKIKIKKNLKKGKYTVKVLVSSEGDGNYNTAEQTVEFVIKVK